MFLFFLPLFFLRAMLDLFFNLYKMQVYSKTDARQHFSSLFNAVRYGDSVVGVGRGKMRISGKVLPEVLMVKLPESDELEVFKKSPLGFEKALQKWFLEKVATSL